MATGGAAGSGRAVGDDAAGAPAAPDSAVTLATVLSRLAAEAADLRAAHAAERERGDRLARELAAALDGLAAARAQNAAAEAALAEAAARDAALRRELAAERTLLAGERRTRAALLLDAERLFQAVERRLSDALVLPLPGRDALVSPSLPVAAGEAPRPVVAVATGLGRRGARRVAEAVARQSEAAGAGAVLVTDEPVTPRRNTGSPPPPLRVVRLPRPQGLPLPERDAYRAGRLRLLIELWNPARVVPFGPDAARLLTLAAEGEPARQAAASSADEGALAARS